MRGSYDHGKKAGNRGDVWKHAVLVSLANRLLPEASFHYAESHAGAACHQLHGRGEWRRGIGQVLERGTDDAHPYLSLAREFVNDRRYPAGWVFFVTSLSPKVGRLTATLYDVGEAVATSYDPPLVNLKPDNAYVRFERRDGYSGVSALGADLVFLDSPFFPKADYDWKRLHRTCSALDEAGVLFVAWYPVYWPSKPESFVTRTSGWAWELRWAPFGRKPSQNLKGCGLAVSSRLAPLLHSSQPELKMIADRLQAEIFVRSPS